jgi:hypothetical protein
VAFEPRPVGRTCRRSGRLAARDMGTPTDPDLQPGGGAWVTVPTLHRPVEPLVAALGRGLVGLHTRQVNYSGRLGAAGFAIASLGGLVVAALSFVYAEWPMLGPYSWGDGSGFGIAVLVWEVGLLLLGIATLRARALPLPWRTLPLAIFSVFPLSIILTPLMLGAGLESEFLYSGVPRALTGIGWVLLGYALWSGIGEDIRRSVPAR